MLDQTSRSDLDGCGHRLGQKAPPESGLRAGALFAGIGGFCLGFAEAGVPTLWAVENDPCCKLTYKANLPHTCFIESDVCDVSPSRHDLEPIDILHAGFPCQSFSQAGGRKGFGDPRGRLFFEILRIIREFKDRKPKVLVLENSPYLRYGEGGAWFIRLLKEIQTAGYWFREENCAELNAYTLTNLPQQRIRLYMVAFSVDSFLSGRFVFPNPRAQHRKRLENFIDFSGSKDITYYLPQGNRYHRMISGLAEDRSVVYQLRKYLVRVKEKDMVPTLTANMGLGGHNVPFIYDSNGLRKLTELECLALQGFPEWFTFPESVPRARRYVQVGNAVTVPVAALLAQQVIEKIDREVTSA